MKYLTFIAVLFLTSCVGHSQNEKAFGEDFDATGAISVQEAIDQTGPEETKEWVIQGTASSVCKMKGCWMTLTRAEGDDIHVTFKDYGFFMPKDIEGTDLVLHGELSKKVTPVDELRHYAEDAGKSEEEIAAITEPKEEYTIIASGVKLLSE